MFNSHLRKLISDDNYIQGSGLSGAQKLELVEEALVRTLEADWLVSLRPHGYHGDSHGNQAGRHENQDGRLQDGCLQDGRL